MASFDIAYNKYIKPAEGGYANEPADKGGETYAGIARKLHPNWPGWVTVDFAKKSGPISRNATIPGLVGPVTEFYKAWWNKGRFSEIQSQDIANLLFDYNVNSGALGIKAIQRIVGTTADGAMGPATVAAINNAAATKAGEAKVYNALVAERKQLYASIVARDPSQQVFWAGWMNRMKNFPELVTPKNTAIVLVVIGLAIWGGYYMLNTKGT